MSRVLATLMFVSVTALLVGARFGFVWAGGEGVVAPLPVEVVAMEGVASVDRAGEMRSIEVGSALRRGEIVRTEANGRVVLQIGSDTFLALDERGALTLDRLVVSEISLHLESGRVLAIAGWDTEKLRVTTHHTASWILEEAFSVVNYDFLETISIVPFRTVVSIFVEPRDAFLSARATNVHETEPVKITDAEFNADAVPFYTWAEEQTGYELSQ